MVPSLWYSFPMSEETSFIAPACARLGLIDAGAVVVGCIIGAGIFRLSGPWPCIPPAPSSSFWLGVGGILSLAGALTFAELSSLYPKNRGRTMFFLTEAYGRMWAFFSAGPNCLCSAVGTHRHHFLLCSPNTAARVFGWPPSSAKAIAVAAIIALTVANGPWFEFRKNIQNIFTSLKVLVLLIIVGPGLLFIKGQSQNFQPFGPEWSWSLVSTTGVP